MEQPNVLFIAVDQWPGALLGCAGHPSVLTPTIDHLARLGTRYTRAYSESPICIPARRSMMTGLSPRGHGDRSFKPAERLPKEPLLAQCFRDAGYQATAIGKLHVFPQRARIGFDDTILAEEGRIELGTTDDYDIYLADHGHTGEQFMHGMSNNDYMFRPWHLEEAHHVTNWTAREAARAIKRRDPDRPGFWHVSFTHPHPPLAPLASYIEMYDRLPIDEPNAGIWSERLETLPQALQVVRAYWPAEHSAHVLRGIRQAYYALCTHIDHQIRVLIGTLRDEGILDDTLIALVSDHGDMLGEHGLWGKCVFYERAANIPFILVGTAGCKRIGRGVTDDRLVALQDIMPTLLDVAGIPIPGTLDGMSAVGAERRDFLYGECREMRSATRMMHDGRHKLIWYPAGNHIQLFDLTADPTEMVDLSSDPAYVKVRTRLEHELAKSLYGCDEAWATDGRLIGYQPDEYTPEASRTFANQRGLHYPPPPLVNPEKSGAMAK
ncbi:sulfatase-like hydrolase/transferase [Paraburkholderia sp. HP33-1]|uniref:sulfatase-like hydrolase/transferase n=1 Tax=Paraburkholderia sp. HP33-1 TaxID=2883243 RepID=UPI001F1735D4|nr:sulfatase-like hydrolase/transferase [Paraburkholderia sp. HP33-1]